MNVPSPKMNEISPELVEKAREIYKDYGNVSGPFLRRKLKVSPDVAEKLVDVIIKENFGHPIC